MLAERFSWTLPEILALTLLQLEELAEAVADLDDEREAERKRAEL